MKKWFEEKILNSNKRTLIFVGVIAFFILFLLQTTLLIKGTYYNNSSDDVVQYSIIVRQYIEMIKSGEISLFNFSNNFGSSIFADVYYLPLDIFFAFTFLLSFVCDPLIAFSCVELLKVILGVVTFAYFLQKCKFNNKIVLLVAFIYFCAGGTWALSVFPTYFSLFFYLPCSLIVVKWFFEEKKWVLPLYSFLLIFHNFYNAYSLYIFMLFAYLIVKIRDNYKGIKNLIKETFGFGLHIVLGVVMGLVILLPSVLYIVKYSTRNQSSFEYLFDFNVYMKMIYRLFVFESGPVNLAEIMAQDGVYHQSHFSYYIGLFGLYLISFLFIMKDRTSRIYKWSIIILLIMMCIPVFSMIYSGVMIAYTRWFTYINIALLYYLAYILSVIDFDAIKKNDKMKALFCLSGLFLVVFVYNIIMFFVCASEDKMYYAYCFVMLLIFGSIAVMYLIFALVKQKKLIWSMAVVEMLIALVLNLSVPWSTSNKDIVKEFATINELLDKLELNQNLERVYFTDTYKHNNNRLTNKLTNEATFHSFLPYYLYEFEDLYSLRKNSSLVMFNLNNFSSNSSRIMDYKYIVVDKERNFGFDYLNKYYEDDNFIVYENVNYNPFYVYEDYYQKEQVLSLAKNDFLHFSKMLFDGVVLEENNYNLNKKDFSYSNSHSKNMKFNHKISLIEKDDEYVEVVDFDYDYSGSVYISGEDLNKIKNVYIDDYDDKKQCDFIYDMYVCQFEDGFGSIVFESDELLEKIDYAIVVEKDEKKYVYKKIEENFEYDYFDYYGSKRSEMLLVDYEGNMRPCTQDFCSMHNFDVDHVLRGFSLTNYIEQKTEFDILYSDVDVEEEVNSDEEYATNKSLSHERSTIKVKYTRISKSSNDQVIVLPITYSDEWVCNNDNYELVKANGGFLGVVVKNNVKNVDIVIKFKPTGAKIGLIGTCIGFGIYGLYLAFTFYRKKKENNLDENI